MRSFRLISIAASAEALRWRRTVRHAGFRALWFGIGLAFAAAAVVLAHVAGAAWIYTRNGGMRAAAAIGAADLVLAALFLWLALRDAPDAIAVQALAVRRQAGAELAAGVARAAVIGRVVRMVTQLIRSRRR